MPTIRKTLIVLCVALPMAAAVLLDAPRAQGDAAADKALAEAVKRGQALWRQSWNPGAKACFACHTRGPNKMTAARVNAYPLYDEGLGRVVNIQQKINQMIVSNSGGKALDLGSDDLNALEAYIKTLR